MISRTSILVPVVLACVIFAAALAVLPARGQAPETIALMAADVNPAGNGATNFGPVDGCIGTEPGAEFQVDIGVDAVPASRPLIAYEFTVAYDPALVEVTGSDNGFLLGAVGVYEPFIGVQDPLPDVDGQFLVSVLDVASNDPAGANMETGPGVLTRLTFRAKAAGQTAISVFYEPGLASGSVPAIIDSQSSVVPVQQVQSGIVAIGQACPTGGGGEPIPPVVQPPPTYEEAPTPGATAPPADATLAPGETPGADGTPAAGGSVTPGSGSPTAAPSGSPSGSPDDEDGEGGAGTSDGGDDGGSDLAVILAALLLAAGGIAAAAAGAWFIIKRSQQQPAAPGGPPATESPPGGDFSGPPDDEPIT